MQRERTTYYAPLDTDLFSAGFALFDTVTPQVIAEQDKDNRRRLVPTMGQLGWQLEEDELSWTRRPSSKEVK